MKGRLIIFCGIPGSGKTTVARIVAQKTGAVHIQTDSIRAMVPVPEYTARESRFVYQAAMATGGLALRAGYDAILDATFPREEYRREAADMLREDCSACKVVLVSCETTVAYRRNLARERPVPKLSFMRILQQFEPPASAIKVDSTDASPESLSDFIMERLAS